MRITYSVLIALTPLACLLVVHGISIESKAQQKADRTSETGKADHKPVAGKADVLKQLKKKFARVGAVDAEKSMVTLMVDGEGSPTSWPVNSDAEIKINGWWGRLTQFNAGDRVWVWFDFNRQHELTSVLMMADEISERDIHGDETADEIEPLRRRQREQLKAIWRKDGLPGSVSVLHKLSGEMDVLLDHEAIRWGRHLSHGDRVTVLSNVEPVKAAVKHVRPWRERTVVRLVTDSGVDQSELSLGDRIRLLVPEPPPEVQNSELPPDIGRERTTDVRVEWFLSSIYCTCRIDGDRCTGMFYTLASCNPNSCGNSNKTRELLAGLIGEGKTDDEIMTHLRETRGPELLKPHLLK